MITVCPIVRDLRGGRVDLQIKLLKWLTNLKNCYTKSLDKLYPVAPLHKIKSCSSNFFVNHVVNKN